MEVDGAKEFLFGGGPVQVEIKPASKVTEGLIGGCGLDRNWDRVGVARRRVPRKLGDFEGKTVIALPCSVVGVSGFEESSAVVEIVTAW